MFYYLEHIDSVGSRRVAGETHLDALMRVGVAHAYSNKEGTYRIVDHAGTVLGVSCWMQDRLVWSYQDGSIDVYIHPEYGFRINLSEATEQQMGALEQ